MNNLKGKEFEYVFTDINNQTSGFICCLVGSEEWYNHMLNNSNLERWELNYLAKGWHFKFENADKKNDIKFFKKNYRHKKHRKFMDNWVKKTTPTFSWDNYNNWKKNIKKLKN